MQLKKYLLYVLERVFCLARLTLTVKSEWKWPPEYNSYFELQCEIVKQSKKGKINNKDVKQNIYKNIINRDGSKDPILPKMEFPVSTVNSFLAINYCQKELQHRCHKNPGSSIDYNSINNEMFSGIFYGFIK